MRVRYRVVGILLCCVTCFVAGAVFGYFYRESLLGVVFGGEWF